MHETMIQPFDLHAHTNFCDGKNSPEEMVCAAIAQGMETVGLVVHSYTDFDESYCVKKENIGVFQDEMRRLKEKYAGRIRVLSGVEQDVRSTAPTDGFDYVIGASHYLICKDRYYTVDATPERIIEAADYGFDGDYYALADAYFRSVAAWAAREKPTVIAHFDLVCKMNRGERFFSETDARYVKSWQRALDALLPLNVPFEVNTGAISRGYRDAPYPNPDMVRYIAARGGKLLLASDSHTTANLRFAFADHPIPPNLRAPLPV